MHCIALNYILHTLHPILFHSILFQCGVPPGGGAERGRVEGVFERQRCAGEEGDGVAPARGFPSETQPQFRQLEARRLADERESHVVPAGFGQVRFQLVRIFGRVRFG